MMRTVLLDRRRPRWPAVMLGLGFALAAAGALAQGPLPASTPRFEGTLLLMTGAADIEVPNDEAVASLYAEVQDADLARAQSQVNARVSAALADLRRLDPKAQFETAGYSSYPVYGRDPGRRVVAWRVRQSVTLRTGDFTVLPRAIAGAQAQLALGGIDFRLTRAARERVEADLVRSAVADLKRRVAAAAGALGVPPDRMRIEELNFGVPLERGPVVMARMAAAPAADAVVEPSFEPGRTTQQVTVSAKVRLLAP